MIFFIACYKFLLDVIYVSEIIKNRKENIINLNHNL